jgi:hypothetical protein
VGALRFWMWLLRIDDFYLSRAKNRCKFEVASAFGLPDTFELHAAGRKHQAMVIHRGTGHVGLKFV